MKAIGDLTNRIRLKEWILNRVLMGPLRLTHPTQLHITIAYSVVFVIDLYKQNDILCVTFAKTYNNKDPFLPRELNYLIPSFNIYL